MKRDETGFCRCTESSEKNFKVSRMRKYLPPRFETALVKARRTGSQPDVHLYRHICGFAGNAVPS